MPEFVVPLHRTRRRPARRRDRRPLLTPGPGPSIKSCAGATAHDLPGQLGGGGGQPVGGEADVLGGGAPFVGFHRDSSLVGDGQVEDLAPGDGGDEPLCRCRWGCRDPPDRPGWRDGSGRGHRAPVRRGAAGRGAGVGAGAARWATSAKVAARAVAAASCRICSSRAACWAWAARVASSAAACARPVTPRPAQPPATAPAPRPAPRRGWRPPGRLPGGGCCAPWRRRFPRAGWWTASPGSVQVPRGVQALTDDGGGGP